MKKRALMLVCALVLLAGCVVMSALAADTGHTAYCEYCQTSDVTWEPIVFGTHTLPEGETSMHKHYYFDKNYDHTSMQQLNLKGNGMIICVDLNGKSWNSYGRAFYVNYSEKDEDWSTINIMDSVGGGAVIGRSEAWYKADGITIAGTNNTAGGTIWVANKCTMNIYGGTFNLNVIESDAGLRTNNGGIAAICEGGELNLYGGTLNGAKVSGSGGAVHLYAGGTLNVFGGSITSGSSANGTGDCVGLAGTTSKIILSGDASVEDIYMSSPSDEKLIVSGTYTGSANLSYGSSVTPTEKMVVGSVASGADLSDAQITCANYFALSEGAKLMLSAYPAGTVAATGGKNYKSLQAAIMAAPADGLVELLTDVSGNVTVDKNIYLQLNGCSISGTVTVAEGCTLYGMDTATMDFTVADGKYGKITQVDGAYAGASVDAGHSDDSYIAVNESGNISFHCVQLQIYAMTLRVTADNNEPGLYYKSNFLADEMAALLLQSYGVALSTQETPNAQNMDTKCKYSTFTGFESGPTGNLGNTSSTLLKGIMKNKNTDRINARNLNVQIYGRAYAKTKDGQILFGKAVCRTLLEQLRGVNQILDNLSNTQVKAATELYHQFKSVLQTRSLDNIAEASETNETGTLKVLVLGNSHGLDATTLLYEVFYQERLAGNHDQDVLIAALYHDGCRMSQHHDYLENNKIEYIYHKNSGTKEDRSWTKVDATCLDALRDEQWDIILMQQMNHYAAREAYYQTSDWKFVADYLLNNQDDAPILGFHMTWANPDDYELINKPSFAESWKNTHEKNFPDPETGLYEQDVMYAEIVRLTQKYLIDSTDWLGKDYFDERYIMSSATAVHYAQNVRGRTHNEIYRDYTHLSDYGRLICAYQWYAQLMGLTEITKVNVDTIPQALAKNNFPSSATGRVIDDEMKADLIASVNWALQHPFNLPEEE